MTQILIKDQTLTAQNSHTWSMEFLEASIPAREFLRRRIYEEVVKHNSKNLERYQGLVQPNTLEQTLNGESNQNSRKLDWEKQYQTALEAFARNGFVMLWNEQQIEDLDELLDLKDGSEATFLKLVPLVGG